MNTTAYIAQHILDVHEGKNWTESDIKSSLSDVTWQEAGVRTAASANSIAALLHHLTFWNRVMIQRIQGQRVIIPEHNGFNVGPLQNEEEWAALKADNLASAHELAQLVLTVDDKRLELPILTGYSTTYKNLQGTVEHIHYRLGQMVLLKNLLRS